MVENLGWLPLWCICTIVTYVREIYCPLLSCFQQLYAKLKLFFQITKQSLLVSIKSCNFAIDLYK